jgi:hypothetical protein
MVAYTPIGTLRKLIKDSTTMKILAQAVYEIMSILNPEKKVQNGIRNNSADSDS